MPRSVPTLHPIPHLSTPHPHVLRFPAPPRHLAPAFGNDAFGRKAETFAHFFGTPTFLLAQTGLVAL